MYFYNFFFLYSCWIYFNHAILINQLVRESRPHILLAAKILLLDMYYMTVSNCEPCSNDLWMLNIMNCFQINTFAVKQCTQSNQVYDTTPYLTYRSHYLLFYHNYFIACLQYLIQCNERLLWRHISSEEAAQCIGV